MFHGGGWFAYIQQDNKKRPKVNRELLGRVWAFARPSLEGNFLLITIFLISSVTAVTPLLMRDLIDNALPNSDLPRLNRVALGLISIPLINGFIGIFQRRLSAQVGEGVIYDLRRTLYEHMQRMSLRFLPKRALAN